MRSRPNEEHENYKDELGDSDIMVLGPRYDRNSTAAEIENEPFRSDYRPMLYDYYVEARAEAERSIKGAMRAMMAAIRRVASR